MDLFGLQGIEKEKFYKLEKMGIIKNFMDKIKQSDNALLESFKSDS